MRAFKGFRTDLTCRGYQFKASGINRTEEANCRGNGFHCAENPLDCLNYYPNWRQSVYYEVEAEGDLDEDEFDSKISCTQLTLIRKLSLEQLLLEAIVYMVRHPGREWNSHVCEEQGTAGNGYAVVRGKNPMARGGLGDILAILKEDPSTHEVLEVGMFRIGGEQYQPDIWHDVSCRRVEGVNEESKAIKAKAA